ncbi:MAG: aminotransferase class I/II-fold pyridoxal phosphate-dependent enzyme [Halobacteriales archaeon]|nr:aminotransferase class I/II-fold pyridoxal phosphate-dependent enzyme [Halobacteriales archaeon]
MDSANNPLELSRAEKERLIDRAVERTLDHLEDIADQPAANLDGVENLAKRLREPLPQEPTSFEELLRVLFEEAIPASVNTIHPGYMAYIPGGGLFHSAVADFIANATNRYVGAWFAAPALVRLEANVVEWFCEIVGLPESAFGLLTTGGSMANQIAITTARRNQLGDNFQDAVIYTSDQSHHSVAKSAVLAGFPPENIRSIPTDDRFRMAVDTLTETITTDRAAGKTPFLVVANAGSTNTGAVDDLQGLADICDREGLWLHADAAYGGFFALTDRGQRKLAGLDRCDSITLDPHKGLFLPYGTGAVLVRDGATLARAHSVDADYMPDWDPDTDPPDFSRLSPELSRDFRGLRVWLPLKMHGIEPFRENLAEKLDLAEYACEHLKAIDHVRVVAEPQLSNLAFRIEPPGVTEDALDDLNRDLMEWINDQGQVHLSGTTLNGQFAIRLSILSFRTHHDAVATCLAEIEDAIATVC